MGVVIALLALNAVFADQLNLQSLFGLEDAAVEEIASFDFYETLNTDLWQANEKKQSSSYAQPHAASKLM